MRQGVLDLRAFYASSLGRAARTILSRRIQEAWGGAGGLDVLALGYATPFLDIVGPATRRKVAAMPAAQGVEAWPVGERNLACLTLEAALPMPNALFDRVLAVHALEESDNPLAVLREIRRVLAPSGRTILVVTARHGLWADAENTPFGHGRPFSRRQIEALVREADLEPVGWTRALYVPPVAWAWRWAEGFEWVGARLWPPFAGVILVEAVKQTFAPRPQGLRARVPARPRYQPAPAGRGIAVRNFPPGSAGTGLLRRARSPES
ncbi:MAG: class I SAM-dependent methyltransferase [Pseudomonadota bacterium]|nr:class I SAM-dependent methyltransferase [Pseudomonadota bacterium]